ncbi:hypothetical protein [Amorphus sp. 3PC139-8]|uniref:hypothetical protein n=1 Tax=Amorphus sp. 3PC139-8 TaxID=2735676 RepID=UPI00345D6AD0
MASSEPTAAAPRPWRQSLRRGLVGAGRLLALVVSAATLIAALVALSDGVSAWFAIAPGAGFLAALGLSFLPGLSAVLAGLAAASVWGWPAAGSLALALAAFCAALYVRAATRTLRSA